MTKKALLTLLESIPDDANIVVTGYSDDIMGDYQYNEELSFHEDKAHKLNKGGSLHMSISNYSSMPHKKVKVWVLS